MNGILLMENSHHGKPPRRAEKHFFAAKSGNDRRQTLAMWMLWCYLFIIILCCHLYCISAKEDFRDGLHAARTNNKPEVLEQVDASDRAIGAKWESMHSVHSASITSGNHDTIDDENIYTEHSLPLIDEQHARRATDFCLTGTVGAVTGLEVYAADGTFLSTVEKGSPVCVSPSFNFFRAVTFNCSTDSIKSVKLVFKIDDVVVAIRKTNTAPYQMQVNNTLSGQALVIATPYSEPNAKGIAGASYYIRFPLGCNNTCTLGTVTDLQLVSNTTGQILQSISQDKPLCIPSPTIDYAIRAIVKPCSNLLAINLVKLVLQVDGKVYVANELVNPYQIELPNITTNVNISIKATPYNRRDALGIAGETKLVRFPASPCARKCRITRFLYQGAPVANNSIVCYVDDRVSLLAETDCGGLTKVEYNMTGRRELTDIQTTAPYSIRGGIRLSIGAYTVQATPYNTAPGESSTIQFYILDCTPSTMLCPEKTGILPADRPGYQICIDLINVPETDYNLFQSASDRWSTLISGDLPSSKSSRYTTSWACNGYPTVIDDLYICGKYEAIDGPGGFIGIGNQIIRRNDSQLPVIGFLNIDTADVDLVRSNLRLESVILHELGHAIGFGTLWDDLKLDTSCSYTGKNANSEWQAVSGCPAKSVPLGTDCMHWSEVCLGDDIMSEFVRSDDKYVVSRITLAALVDLGYEVDYSQAEDIVINPTCQCGRRLRTAAEPRVSRKLSREGLRKAQIYGRQHLEKMSKLRQDSFGEDENVVFVGDRSASVLYMEDEQIYHIVVTR